MNIIQIGTGTVRIPPRGYGGIERYVFEISTRLARAGHSVSVLDIKDLDTEPEVETLAGIKFLRLQTKSKVAPSRIFILEYIASKLRLIGFALSVSKHLKHNDYDIIHLHVTIIGLVLIHLNKNLRGRMVYTVHSPIWAMSPLSRLDRLSKWLDCYLMRRVGRVLAQAESSKDKLVATVRIPAQKFSVVPSGVDTAIYHPTEPDENIVGKYGLAQKSVILFAGRIVPYKGVIYLVKAADIVVNRFGYKDTLFLPVGPIAQHGLDSIEHAQYVSQILEFIKDKNLEKNVKLPGAIPQDDLIKLFYSCDVFVLPSLAESSPAVTLQAMSCAKPVIATAVGGLPDQIKDGWNGFLVEPADERALADKIKYLLDHPAERLKMGQNARQLAEIEFDWKSIVEKIIKVYREVAKS